MKIPKIINPEADRLERELSNLLGSVLSMAGNAIRDTRLEVVVKEDSSNQVFTNSHGEQKLIVYSFSLKIIKLNSEKKVEELFKKTTKS